jgi:hypothetical protein
LVCNERLHHLGNVLLRGKGRGQRDLARRRELSPPLNRS